MTNGEDVVAEQPAAFLKDEMVEEKDQFVASQDLATLFQEECSSKDGESPEQKQQHLRMV